MTRRYLVLLVAALALAPAATTTAAPGLPAYIVDKGIAFGIYANQDWKGAGVTPDPVEKGEVDRGPVPSQDRSFVIWTKNCVPGQVASFEREVEFLGRPFTLGGFTQTGLDVETWDIYFNGKKVRHLLKRVQPDFTLAHRKLLKLGMNTIRYTVKLSEAAGACTENTRAERHGVWFSLTGINATDATVTRPPRMDVYQQGREYLQPITVTNRGRARLTEAVLSIAMASHVGCLEFNPDNTCKEWMFNVDILTSDLRCKRVVPQTDPADRRFLECAITNLPAGASDHVQVRMSFQPSPNAPNWLMQENRLTWELKHSPGATADSGPNDNNKAEVHVTYCQYGPGATGCKPKP